MDSHSALIIDVGLGGAFIEHRGRANQGLRFRLSFKWQGQEIAFDSVVTRSTVVREGGEDGVVSQSAVQFTKPHGDAAVRLQDMMGVFIEQLLVAQRVNARGTDGRNILDRVGQARRDRARGLMTYRWDGETWSSSPTTDPRQPLDGFTVAAHEDEDELATLCRAYEDANEEGRQLIRLSAELSARGAAVK